MSEALALLVGEWRSSRWDMRTTTDYQVGPFGGGAVRTRCEITASLPELPEPMQEVRVRILRGKRQICPPTGDRFFVLRITSYGGSGCDADLVDRATAERQRRIPRRGAEA